MYARNNTQNRNIIINNMNNKYTHTHIAYAPNDSFSDSESPAQAYYNNNKSKINNNNNMKPSFWCTAPMRSVINTNVDAKQRRSSSTNTRTVFENIKKTNLVSKADTSNTKITTRRQRLSPSIPVDLKKFSNVDTSTSKTHTITVAEAPRQSVQVRTTLPNTYTKSNPKNNSKNETLSDLTPSVRLNVRRFHNKEKHTNTHKNSNDINKNIVYNYDSTYDDETTSTNISYLTFDDSTRGSDLDDVMSNDIETNTNDNSETFYDAETTTMSVIEAGKIDCIVNFEVCMGNLMQSHILFDQFSQQLQAALNYLQNIDFSYRLRFSSPLLPNQDRYAKPTLVLDLDETLMHCSPEPLEHRPIPDFKVYFDQFEMPERCGYIYVRPYAIPFLKAVSKLFEVVIFTASTKPYADQVLDTLDPKGDCIHHRLYRPECSYESGGYVKDLRHLGRDLKQTMLVDNSPISAAHQLDNFIPVSSWYGEHSDSELFDLLNFLETLNGVPNVAKSLAKSFGFRDWINQYRRFPNNFDHYRDL